MSEWDICYKRAINPDGSLLFPERLTDEFLDKVRRSMGSYLFANQYMNQIIPEDQKVFKPAWIRYYEEVPKVVNNFAFVDPAIGQKDRNDYTGIAVISVDPQGRWFVIQAGRYRLTPSEIVSKLFEMNAYFNLSGIGVEVVAYQEALLYLLAEEMQKRQAVLPVKGITRSHQSKKTRILGLVPRMEWGSLYLNRGLKDLEDEMATFPRGSHDDVLDALASLEEIVFYPEVPKEKPLEQPKSASDPLYEKWYIQDLVRKSNSPQGEDD